MTASAENGPQPVGAVWMLDLDERVPWIMPLVAVTYRRLDPKLLSALVSTLERAASAEILQRLETGRRCYTAWVTFNKEDIDELNLQMKLLPGEVYIWDCATIPAFRRNRLYSALLGYIIGELRSEGFCRAWIGTDLDNKPSQQGIARAGFHHIADLIVARTLAVQQSWLQGQPGVPEHIIAEARRAFLNDRDKV